MEVPESMLKEILLQEAEKKILQGSKSKSKGLVQYGPGQVFFIKCNFCDGGGAAII